MWRMLLTTKVPAVYILTLDNFRTVTKCNAYVLCEVPRYNLFHWPDKNNSNPIDNRIRTATLVVAGLDKHLACSTEQRLIYAVLQCDCSNTVILIRWMKQFVSRQFTQIYAFHLVTLRICVLRTLRHKQMSRNAELARSLTLFLLIKLIENKSEHHFP